MKTIEEAANEFALCALMDYDAEKELNDEVDVEEFSNECFKAGVEFAQRWISVEEELPEDSGISESVNTKTEDGYIFIHRRLFIGGKYVWSNGNDTSIAFWKQIQLR